MTRAGGPARPRRTLGPTTAADAVNQALRHHHITDEIRGERVVTEWTELVGAKIAQRTRPDGIFERTLWIEVVSSAWMRELDLLKPQLVKGLVERLGEPRLFDDVKFRIASRHRRGGSTVPRSRAPQLRPQRLATSPATGAARETIVREVAAVDDGELRELIARVRIAWDR